MNLVGVAVVFLVMWVVVGMAVLVLMVLFVLVEHGLHVLLKGAVHFEWRLA